MKLSDVFTIDKKVPKIKAPNVTEIDITGFKIPDAGSFLGNGFPKLKILNI